MDTPTSTSEAIPSSDLVADPVSPDAWSPDGTTEAPTRRITVFFDGPTPGERLALEFAATRAEAWEFATAAMHSGLAVTVDAEVRPGLRPLPCRSLWH